MVDLQPQSTQPISDDQELAKVLAGVTDQSDDDLSLGELASPVAPAVDSNEPADDIPAAPSDDAPIGYNPPSDSTPTPSMPSTGLSNYVPTAEPASEPVNTDLEGIKKDALNELRPLVDKLQLEPEEKFDTYLLLLRSTDDKDLIAPAFSAARAIPDETRRAQALLDVIKEIDFLSNPK